jgi:hypothetical protein
MAPLLVFVHINKTAGTTVRYILRSSYGTRHCDVEPWKGEWAKEPFSTKDLQRIRRLYPRLASIAGHRITGYSDLELPDVDFRYFTYLREPIALCASRFQYQLDHRHKRNLVFEEWIHKDWVRNAQTQRIAGTSSAADAIAVLARKQIFVGLTESFDESLVLLKALRAPDLDISYLRVNVAKKSRVAKDLLTNASTRQMIVDANEADLEVYEHARRELVPALRREYGPSLEAAVAAYRSASRARFNKRNLALHRVKQHAIHKPMLHLYRARAVRRER